MKHIILILITIMLLASCSTGFTSTNKKTLVHSERMSRIGLKEPLPSYFIPQNLNITVVGDSLTRGYGSEDEMGYMSYLENALMDIRGISSVNYMNFGVVGQTSKELSRKLSEKAVEEAIGTTDLIIITTGGNDIMNIARQNLSNLQLDQFLDETENFKNNVFENLRKVEQLNPTATILLVGVYNPFASMFPEISELGTIVSSWNETGSAVCSEYENCYFVDIGNVFDEDPFTFLYEDFFHPNDAGYQKIAEEIFKTLHIKVEPNEFNDWFIDKE